MPERDDILNDMKEATSRLQRTKNDGFRVPEGYFEQLPDLVFTKIRQEDAMLAAQPKRLSFLANALERFAMLLQPHYATIAFASIALLIMAVLLLPKSTSNIKALAFEDLEREEVVQYIENNIDEFEEELFISEYDSTVETEYLESILEEIDINTLKELF